jgi:predicted aspartyl protease
MYKNILMTICATFFLPRVVLGAPPKFPPTERSPRTDLSRALKGLEYNEIHLISNNSAYYVRLLVNGNPFIFLLDSGAPFTALYAGAAHRLKLPVTEFKKIAAPFGGTYQLGESKIESLRVAAITLSANSKLPVIDTDMSPMTDSGNTLQCDGLFGQDLLVRFSAIIDFELGVLYLLDPGRFHAQLQGMWRCELSVSNGKKEVEERVSNTTLSLSNDAAILFDGIRKERFKVTLVDHVFPKAIDLVDQDDPTRKLIRGRLILDRDRLELLLGPPGESAYPDTISAPKSVARVLTFRRPKSNVQGHSHEVNSASESALATIGGSEYVRIPFRQDTDEYSKLEMEIDNVRCKMLLDTGSSNLVVASTLADRLHLKTVEGPVVRTGGRELKTVQATLSSIRCAGGFESLFPSAIVVDLTNLNRKILELKGQSADGIVGWSALNSHGAIIDYLHGTLHLSSVEKLYRRRLGGNWNCIYCSRAGVISGREETEKLRIRFGDRLILIEDGHEIQYTYDINQGGRDTRYVAIDIEPTALGDGRRKAKGIVSISSDGKTMFLALTRDENGERPHRFDKKDRKIDILAFERPE